MGREKRKNEYEKLIKSQKVRVIVETVVEMSKKCEMTLPFDI